MERLPSSSLMDQLLPDCKDHVFQFLTLQECLNYGTTSKTSLHDVLPNLRQRRKNQFLTVYCYQIEYPSVLKPVKSNHDTEPPTRDSVPITNQPPDDTAFCSRLVDKDHWHQIPSVCERIVSLYRAMPSSHPVNKELLELISDLKQGDQNFSQAHKSSSDVDLSSSYNQLQRCTKAHRLHASILAQCTVHSNPSPCSRYSAVNVTNVSASDPTSLNVTLETYVGDVLCACYMMGHKVAGIIEGGFTHVDWCKHILSLVQKKQTHYARSWYQFWVYLHSTLLRTFPFTPSQMMTLLGSTSGICGTSVPHNVDYIHPHYCYLGMEAHLVQQTTKVVRTLLLQLANSFGEPPAVTTRMAHQTTMNHFGPLGPSFRGRDEIRTRIMNPFSLLHRLHHPSYEIPTTWFLVQQKEHMIIDSRTFHSWFAGTDTVVRWMLELKEECGKSRPMTVTPPIVTIEHVPLNRFMTDNAIQ
jgi:hypothetical protein